MVIIIVINIACLSIFVKGFYKFFSPRNTVRRGIIMTIIAVKKKSRTNPGMVSLRDHTAGNADVSDLMACFELLCSLIDSCCGQPADNANGDGVEII